MTASDATLDVFRDFVPVTLWRCKKCGVICGKQDAIPFHTCKPVALNFGKDVMAK
jgi:hypothetical protein